MLSFRAHPGCCPLGPVQPRGAVQAGAASVQAAADIDGESNAMKTQSKHAREHRRTRPRKRTRTHIRTPVRMTVLQITSIYIGMVFSSVCDFMCVFSFVVVFFFIPFHINIHITNPKSFCLLAQDADFGCITPRSSADLSVSAC